MRLADRHLEEEGWCSPVLLAIASPVVDLDAAVSAGRDLSLLRALGR
jgi:hypothetical protein